MKIITLINNFNETLQNNLNCLNIESKVWDIGDNFTKDFYTTLINDILKEIKSYKDNQKEVTPPINGGTTPNEYIITQKL